MAFWEHLVDDVPPDDVPLDLAIKEHREHLVSPYAGLVGALVVRDTALGGLPHEGLFDLSVRVTGGAGAIEPAVHWTRDVTVRRMTIALRDEDDLPRNAQRVAAMVDHVGLEAPMHVAVPRTSEHSWLAALDELALAGLGLLLRHDSEPGPDIEAAIDAALDRELAFVVVADDNADDVVDVVSATARALHGDPDPQGWESARRWLTAVECSDPARVRADLVERGLW